MQVQDQAFKHGLNHKHEIGERVNEEIHLQPTILPSPSPSSSPLPTTLSTNPITNPLTSHHDYSALPPPFLYSSTSRYPHSPISSKRFSFWTACIKGYHQGVVSILEKGKERRKRRGKEGLYIILCYFYYSINLI